MSIEIYTPETKVKLSSEHEATILAICIRSGNITYECVWWDGDSRRTAWLSECEIKGNKLNRVKLGFK